MEVRGAKLLQPHKNWYESGLSSRLISYDLSKIENLERLVWENKKIPYYKQNTNFSCGPAIIKSLLAGLKNINEDEEVLIKKMYTNSFVGTFPYFLIKTAKKYGLEFIKGKNGVYH